MFTTNPETQIEVEKLAAVLRDLPIDAIASYATLSNVVGYSVQEHPFTLMKARKKVETETGMRFATVVRQGVKKLEAEAVVGIGVDTRKKIARTAKRQHARLSGLRYNSIHPALQARIDAERSLLGAISVAARADAESMTEATQTGPMVAATVLARLANKG